MTWKIAVPKEQYCRFCGKSFTAYRFLRNHDRVHTRLKPFQCLVCQHSSAQEANIWTHILAQHYQQYLKTKKSLCRPDQAALCQESAELTRWLTSDEHRSWAAADSAAAAAAAAQEEASSCEQNQSLKPKRISMSLRSQSSQSDDDANASGSSGKSKDTEPENNNSSSCVSFDNHLSQSSVHNQASTPPPPLPPSSSSQSTEETNSVLKTSRQGKSYISKFFICRQAGCQARFRSLHQLLTHDRSHSQVKPFQCRLCSLRTAEQAELFGHLQQLHYAAVPSTSTDSADQNHRFQRYIEVDEAWIDQERVEIKHWLGTEQCRMKENDLQQTAAAQNGMIIANSSIDGGGSGSGSLRATNSITTTNTITTITTTTTTTITPVLESPPIDTTLTTTFTCQFTSCRQSFASFSNYYRHCSKAHHSKLKLYRCTFEQCDYASVKGMRSVKEHYLEKHAKLQSNSDTSELRGERKRKRKVGKDRQSGFEDEDEDEIDDDEDDDDGDGDNNGNDNDDENDDDENDELIIDTKEKPSGSQ
ncbi:hypothetical protein TYRP_015095 [Tyrophagus putrescentiae]|nr:hypothetical protein TYRP_015095 [Tyrophagus putrescentiae]